MTNYYTYEEIKRQPKTWQQTIEVVLNQAEEIALKFSQLNPDQVIFIGCGTSYYISMAAALTFQEQTGISAKAVPASEIFLKPKAVISTSTKTLMIGLSRSGNTSEVVRAIEYVQKNHLADCISITADPTSQMAAISEFTITLPFVQEKSVVMTSSFTNLLLATQLIAGVISNDQNYLSQLKQLPVLGNNSIGEAEELAKKIGTNLKLENFIYLGLGSYLGLAYEGMLKMKEMTQSVSEAFNPMEFRHGPISVLTDKYCVFLLNHHSIVNYEWQVAEDVQNPQASVVVIGDQVDVFPCELKLDLHSGISDHSRLILYLPVLQLTAYYRTLALGLNPDKPRNLNQVVVLEEI